MMLVLSRKRDENVVIDIGRLVRTLAATGQDLSKVQLLARVMVVDVRGDKVRLGFDTTPAVSDDVLPIHRQEVWDAIQRDHARKKASVREVIDGAGLSASGSAGSAVGAGI